MSSRPLRIGTRASDLARRQAESVRDSLAIEGHESELVFISSRGDVATDVPLRGLEGVGFFSAEIEQALLRGDVDIAVHSLKDLPTAGPGNLVVAATPPREDPRDVLLVHPDAWDETAGELPLRRGARVGTSSERRAALLLAVMPRVEVQPIRGNVPVRMDKVRRREYDATMLAAAGLLRLGLDPASIDGLHARILDVIAFPPAPGQGALAVQVRAADARARDAVAPLNDPATMRCVGTERRLLAMLGGGCSLPLGCLARLEGQGDTDHGAPAAREALTLHLHAALARDGAIRRSEAQGVDPDDIARRVMHGLGGPVRPG